MNNLRGFLQDIMEDSMKEIHEQGTFSCMAESVKTEQKKKSDLLQIIQK